MRVLIDGRPLQGPTGARGVGHYVRDLVRGLLALDDAPEVALLVDPRADPPQGGLEDRVRWVEAAAPAGPALAWGRLLGPRWIKSAGVDLWHATFLAPPRTPRGFPWVATIHDLIPLRHPGPFSPRQRLVFSRSLALSARAPRVVAVSRFTAELVTATFGTRASRVEVIPTPVDVGPFLRASRRGCRGVTGPYLLHLGGFDALKGVADLLLPAFAVVGQEHPDLALVLTGPPGPAREKIEQAVRDLGLEERVVFPGVLRDDDHVAAVAGASAVVVSSREEGFGIPVVEALAAGVPLALGPAAATRETAGSCAALAPDDTPAGLAEAVEEALSSGGPGSADGARRRAHAARFDHKVAARQILGLYRRVIEESG